VKPRARFEAVHPVIPVRDVAAAIEYYGRLGFVLAFRDPSGPTRYAGIRRDDVEVHLQWMDEAHFAGSADRNGLRFMVDDVDLLYSELGDREVLTAGSTVRDTPWMTREFAFYDPDGNGLTFYRDVTA
jgi:catechol 2,3-dioxygenase-like lactoylglutathione lyase family enzyme